MSLGFDADGKRLRRKVSGQTKAEVKDKLKALHSELDAGLRTAQGYTMEKAVADWLEEGLPGRTVKTVEANRDSLRPGTPKSAGCSPCRPRRTRDQAAAAARIDVLAVRALGLIALNDSLMRGPLAARGSAVDVRVLLLDPDSPAAAIRAAEIGESPGSFGAGIRLALARLAEFADHPFVRLRTALYDSLPTWRMLVFDGTLYLSAFASSSEGHRSGM